jgi:hypothetical protein
MFLEKRLMVIEAGKVGLKLFHGFLSCRTSQSL